MDNPTTDYTTQARTLARRMVYVWRDPRTWTKGFWARRSPRGPGLNYDDPKATCFCAVGLMRKLEADENILARLCELTAERIKEEDRNNTYACIGSHEDVITTWNDERKRTIRDVRSMFHQIGDARFDTPGLFL